MPLSSTITAAHVSKDFINGETVSTVLKDVSLTLEAGTLTLLTGPSGCGKTTLLSILAGILSPAHGSVEIFGTKLEVLSKTAIVQFRRNNIGFIFQQYNLLPALTAAENAAIPLVASGISLRTATSKAKEMLKSLGMDGHLDKLPRQLSGGQQQRVAIARALVHEPRFVVCDEPTAALDAGTGKEVMNLLQTAARRPDRCVLVVTHDNRIYDYADRILKMEDGKLLG